LLAFAFLHAFVPSCLALLVFASICICLLAYLFVYALAL
jgi:hypothetical protein